jgi:hypothetical protein
MLVPGLSDAEYVADVLSTSGNEMIRKPSCKFGKTDVTEIPDTERMLVNIKRHAGITEAQRLIAFTKLRVEILHQVNTRRPPIRE